MVDRHSEQCQFPRRYAVSQRRSISGTMRVNLRYEIESSPRIVARQVLRKRSTEQIGISNDEEESSLRLPALVQIDAARRTMAVGKNVTLSENESSWQICWRYFLLLLLFIPVLDRRGIRPIWRTINQWASSQYYYPIRCSFSHWLMVRQTRNYFWFDSRESCSPIPRSRSRSG